MLDDILSGIGSLPTSYICVDSETTGVDASEDLIVELGYCLVDECEADSYESHVLDWTRIKGIDPKWIKHKLDACQKEMEARGKHVHMTYERMRDEGQSPQEVLSEYKEIFDIAREEGAYIAGHNVIYFDVDRIEQAINEWLDEEEDWKFPQDVIDTAAIEKAILTGMSPWWDESFYEYQFRVLDRPAPGVHYSLDNHCVPKYALLNKYHDVDMSDAHTAGFDAMLVHLLLEEFRTLEHESV